MEDESGTVLMIAHRSAASRRPTFILCAAIGLVRWAASPASQQRPVPKHFAILKGVDPTRRQVTLLLEGETLAKV